MASVSANRVAGLAALDDPLRRRLYGIASERAVSRDEAADLLGIPRSTAAFHLDRLAEAELVTVSYRRLSGRTGPGAGRPSKLYAAAFADVIGSVPERHYELAGGLLASAIERADEQGVPVRDALEAEAYNAGTSIGAASADLQSALTQCGYDPSDDGAGGVLLENCPFHALAVDHRTLVCTANAAFVQGLADGVGDARESLLEPRDDHCCVVVRPADTAAQ